MGESFEISENVGGMVIIIVKDHLSHAGVIFKNIIKIDNVTDIEIMSEHEM